MTCTCGDLGYRPRYDLPHPENQRSSQSATTPDEPASPLPDAKGQEPT